MLYCTVGSYIIHRVRTGGRF